jgi:hypothetical protein
MNQRKELTNMKMHHVQRAIWQAWTANLLIIALVSGAQADSIEGSASNDFLDLSYSRNAGLIGLNDQELTLSLFMNEENNVIPYATLSKEVLKGATPIHFNIGARIYFAALTEPDDDVAGVAFGASGRYKLPFDRIPGLGRFPISIRSSIFFAPSITTSGSGIEIIDADFVRAEIELTPLIRGFAGLRLLEFDRNSGEDRLIDSVIYGGASFTF